MKLKLLSALCIITLSVALNAQDTVMNFTLKQAQDYAIEHYFESVNAKMDIEKAQKKIWETTAIGLPQVSGELGYQHIPGEIPEFDLGMDTLFSYLYSSLIDLGYPPPPSLTENQDEGDNKIAPKNSLSYTLTVSQLIFSGEYIVGLQASKVYKSLSEESYEKTLIAVKENIAGTYYGILVLEDNLKSLQKTYENLKLTYDHTKSYFDVGLVEDTDVDQLELIVKSTENSLKSIERQVATLHSLFKFQLGAKSNTQIQLTDSLNELLITNIVDPDKLNFDLESNIDYQMLETQSKLMKLDMNRSQSQFLPSVAAFYQYTDKTNKTAIDFTINHMIGLNVSVPIFSSGQRMSVVAQKQIEYEKARNMQEQQSEMIKISAMQAKYNYHNAMEKFENEKKNLELAEKILNKTNIKYKEGVVSSIDLSQINNQYLQAQMNYSAAVQELLSAKTELDKTHNQL